MTKDINEMKDIIKELKQYEAMKKELDAEIDKLKAEAIEIMTAADIDEYTCDEGKTTYREVMSKRFATTEFKKVHADLYDAFVKQTKSMRFTCN